MMRKSADSCVPLYLPKDIAHARQLPSLKVSLESANGSQTTGDIEVDLKKRAVFVRGAEVHLTRVEYNLLQVLNPSRRLGRNPWPNAEVSVGTRP